MMEREEELINRYYTLSEELMAAQDGESYDGVLARMGELFVELVGHRQETAAYAGYDSYADFAYEFYYTRDYTPAQAGPYLREIGGVLGPLYRDAQGMPNGTVCREADMMDYVQTAATGMGGTVAEAYEVMRGAGLYDIRANENKYNSSFEVYLYDYGCPFVFVNPEQNQGDKLTFAHEFGHFANDFACGGSNATVDVAEFFSQGFEYLSLFYAWDPGYLTDLKMLDCLCIFVEQAAYAEFELRAYELQGEELTPENVRELFRQTCEEFGMDMSYFEPEVYVTIPHFFTNPMYIISYVVSNDAAFQLYQLEQAESGAGREKYEELLDWSGDGFLTFLEDAELDSPFESGRVESVGKTLKELLN
jgi:oligoendopeptidase F